MSDHNLTAPLVSIIVPCYNERTTITLLLEAIHRQTYPHSRVEVIIADGRSTDGTRGVIEAYARDHPDLAVRVVDNPEREIPAGLNRALEAAKGEFIVRLDAHSVPYPDYVARCVTALQAGRGDNVGGVWEIRPQTQHWVARGIATAAAHPLGVGDARYRYAREAQVVDTVPFGAYRRSLVEKIGFYDETLLTNEDYEFNTRIRQACGTIWLDPRIRCIYYARPTLGSLCRQYWRYGFWKLRMLLRYPRTLRWRQLAPLLVLSLAALSLLAVRFPLARLLLALELGTYGGLLLVAGQQASLQKRDLSMMVSVPLAIAAMHLTWGTGFLWSLIRTPFDALRNWL